MLDEIAKDIARTVQESVSLGLKSLENKIEARLKALEAREIPEAIKGDKGDSVTIDDIAPMVNQALEEAIKSIAAPKDGEDGTSVTIDDVKPLVEQSVNDAVKSLPAPKDGKDADPVNMEDIQKMIDEAVSKAVSEIHIPKPRDGEDGRDAVDIEILPSIDEEKSYTRGTYASHNGGLWRSYQKTHGMRGWECIVNGVHKHEVEYDGERKAVIKSILSDGREIAHDVKIPALIGKGVWREGSYEKGDSVQLSGTTWLCVEDTQERPGEGSKAWIVSAKRGGTGESAYDIARKAGFQGDKMAWLESLGKPKVVKI